MSRKENGAYVVCASEMPGCLAHRTEQCNSEGHSVQVPQLLQAACLLVACSPLGRRWACSSEEWGSLLLCCRTDLWLPCQGREWRPQAEDTSNIQLPHTSAGRGEAGANIAHPQNEAQGLPGKYARLPSGDGWHGTVASFQWARNFDWCAEEEIWQFLASN